MTMENERAVIGGNNPPDPIDTITAPFDDARQEAEQWLDGSKVETRDQMDAADALRADMRKWRLGLEAGQKSATAPLYDEYKREGERWKPVIEDAKRIEAGLVSIVGAFKTKLAAEQAEAKRKADAEAWEATRAAREAAAKADASNIEAQREAAQKIADAEEAQKRAAAVGKDTVKGMRTVTRYEITDHRALLNWIAKNHRDDITAFIEEWARRNHKNARAADGLTVTDTKEAY